MRRADPPPILLHSSGRSSAHSPQEQSAASLAPTGVHSFPSPPDHVHRPILHRLEHDVRSFALFHSDIARSLPLATHEFTRGRLDSARHYRPPEPPRNHGSSQFHTALTSPRRRHGEPGEAAADRTRPKPASCRGPSRQWLWTYADYEGNRGGKLARTHTRTTHRRASSGPRKTGRPPEVGPTTQTHPPARD